MDRLLGVGDRAAGGNPNAGEGEQEDEVQVSEIAALPAVETITLSGRLDGRCTSELREVLALHLGRHPDADVHLDMSAVESADLTVVRLLAAVGVRLQRSGHRLVLVGCKPSVRRVLTHGALPRLIALQRTPPHNV